MRRVLAGILVCLVLVCVTGCDSKDTLMQLIVDAKYQDARDMALRMYKDDREELLVWLTLISDHEGEGYMSKVEIQKGWRWTYDDILDTVEGRVKNTGDSTISYMEITVKFLDAKEGNVIDSDWTNIARDIGPGEQASFEILHRRGSGYRWAQLTISKVNLK